MARPPHSLTSRSLSPYTHTYKETQYGMEQMDRTCAFGLSSHLPLHHAGCQRVVARCRDSRLSRSRRALFQREEEG